MLTLYKSNSVETKLRKQVEQLENLEVDVLKAPVIVTNTPTTVNLTMDISGFESVRVETILYESDSRTIVDSRTLTIGNIGKGLFGMLGTQYGSSNINGRAWILNDVPITNKFVARSTPPNRVEIIRVVARKKIVPIV